MCGITGFWSETLEPGAANGLLEKMTSALAHRGPDGAGAFHRDGVALGHRRLAIVDLSPTGHQPMTSASGRFTITFNGEVYNFGAIRKELDAAGKSPAWKGSSDTEVMLAAIEAWGLEGALEHFVGMFAFALWDARERRLHLVRDRVGIKPLYYSTTEAGLCFGSELKALRHFPGFRTSINRPALAGYLRSNCVPGEQSIFEGSHNVPPGAILTFEGPGGTARRTQYWDPSKVVREAQANPFRGSLDEAVEEVDALLRDSIRLRLVADVPLGAFLSGGIDSSTVVALMQAQSERPVHTFSIENESSEFDEGDAARAVARHLNTHHTAFTVTAKDALAVIPRLPTMYDEPFADSSQIPTFLVSQLARRDVTVALSGDGGDELFGGYTRHVWGPRIFGLEQRLPRPLRRSLAELITSRSPHDWDEVFRRGGPLLGKVRLAGIRMYKAASVLDVETPEAMYDALASHWSSSDNVLLEATKPASRPPPALQLDVAEYMMFGDLVGYLPDDILTKVDRASMAVSLETREPLLDHRLIAFAWRLPLGFKVRGATGKWVLRKVLERYVPPGIVSGSKMGFGVPLGDWLRGPLRGWAEDLLDESRLKREGLFNPSIVAARWREHLNGERPWEYHLWDILMFQAWKDANH